MTSREKHDRMANAIRFLSMDAVEKAQSGHPGLPMGCADIATVLFTKYLNFDPKNPHWPDRDRFVLSAGHGSMLLYSLLYLTGYEDITIDEIKHFRQVDSKTAGHPEYGHAAGIETTTGPLGQGIGNSVGMALAERKLRAEFGEDLVDHHTYVLAGDGCLMEGISQEAIALAGHLKLNKLVLFWDNNGISIDGDVHLSDSTDQIERFKAVHWHTIEIDGHDPEAIAGAIEEAHTSDRPTMIACKTTIGFGAPTKAGTQKAHGSALGEEEIAETRKNLGWDSPPFEIPSDILDAWRLAGLRSTSERKEWEQRLKDADSNKRADFERRAKGELVGGFDGKLEELKRKFADEKPKDATRKHSEAVLEVVNGVLPEMLGGSADLTPSNNTQTSQMKDLTADDFSGRYVHYGIREHAMVAAMSGIALHEGLIPYGGTFMCFTDYCRPAIRLASMMGVRAIYVLTHDSIGLGEDGPTHQPVEHLAALRVIPNLLTFRPADATETLECWQLALESNHRPSGMVLSRQKLRAARTDYSEENLSAYGAYDLSPSSNAEVTIFASGSEVEIALDAKEMLEKEGRATRVVSVPSMELFHEQTDQYKAAIIGNSPVKVAIEAGVRQGWDAFIGHDGIFVGMHGFGASGAYEDLYRHFDITASAAVEAVRARLNG
ncbi:transketolase [Pararhizobium mangrovi]|uniref:Transketolase n=1 Tax=Pararhizobium mangrovi TaxID=2590452 RepID=A0A506U1H5_9HYPH|nr:transketolase [Pararhizobium mangrovi]TPW27600.1 transketolase [Pararhizobium mangrovi]